MDTIKPIVISMYLGNEVIDIIGYDNKITLYNSSIKFVYNDHNTMIKKIKQLYYWLIEQGFTGEMKIIGDDINACECPKKSA